jgi:hypothetical protein
MGQEIVFELAGRHKDCIEQLLNLRVPCLSALQDLTDKVHNLLFNFRRGFRPFNGDDCTDNYVGSCNIIIAIRLRALVEPGLAKTLNIA